MAALRRTLIYAGSGGDISVPITIGAPARSGADWACRYEIGWVDGSKSRVVHGIDAIQCIELTLRVIGAEVYTSAEHRSGKLRWLEEGQGYGFPIATGLRDLLVGDDARFFG